MFHYAGKLARAKQASGLNGLIRERREDCSQEEWSAHMCVLISMRSAFLMFLREMKACPMLLCSLMFYLCDLYSLRLNGESMEHYDGKCLWH